MAAGDMISLSDHRSEQAGNRRVAARRLTLVNTMVADSLLVQFDRTQGPREATIHEPATTITDYLLFIEGELFAYLTFRALWAVTVLVSIVFIFLSGRGNLPTAAERAA